MVLLGPPLRGFVAALLLPLTGCFDSFEPAAVDTVTTTAGSATAGSTTAGPTTGEGPTTAADSTGTTGDSESSADSSTGSSLHVPCPAGAFEGPLPASLEADTTEQIDELQGTCGGGSAPEIAYTFTAPRSGTYTFDTGGSAIDTVLYLLEGVCEGPQLSCDDDGLAGSNASLTSVTLRAGQTITVVVDAFGIGGGPVRVTAREGGVTCPVAPLGPGLPQTVSGQTVVARDDFEPTCGTEDEGDQGFSFTAPVTSFYRFDTEGSDFDTTLQVVDGTCEGRELACNDDAPGSFDGHSALALPLQAGQGVTAVVEGFFGASGQLELTVDRLPGTCPDEDLGALAVPFAVMGSTVSTDEASAGSCGGLGSPDYAYLWTAPADAVYRFDTAGSELDTVLYLLEGSCLGAERTCNDDAGGPAAAAAAFLAAGETVVIVVDGAGETGDFTLTVEETTDSGDCCVPQMDPGCELPAIQVCVCTLDAFCCSTSWDATCVDAAVGSCGAVCL
ncbi:MAG: hypothetical protein AB1Z98_37105 [Nannocystaceae bacterium]